jgi:hypothetical protein
MLKLPEDMERGKSLELLANEAFAVGDAPIMEIVNTDYIMTVVSWRNGWNCCFIDNGIEKE